MSEVVNGDQCPICDAKAKTVYTAYTSYTVPQHTDDCSLNKLPLSVKNKEKEVKQPSLQSQKDFNRG